MWVFWSICTSFFFVCLQNTVIFLTDCFSFSFFYLSFSTYVKRNMLITYTSNVWTKRERNRKLNETKTFINFIMQNLVPNVLICKLLTQKCQLCCGHWFKLWVGRSISLPSLLPVDDAMTVVIVCLSKISFRFLSS